MNLKIYSVGMKDLSLNKKNWIIFNKILQIEAGELSIIRKEVAVQLEAVDHGTIAATPYGKSIF